MGDDSGTGGEPPGEPTHGTVVVLHGFTQTGRCLGPVADWLGEHRALIAPDLPGHGEAAALADMDCIAAADHLAETNPPAHWVGYSLGGRIALHVALAHPASVRSLVLIGATAGITDRSRRERRRAVDDERAAEVERLGIREFTRRWLQMDMFSALPERARFMRERLGNTTAGLAGSLRNAGTGSMVPLWERLGELDMPVLLLTGERDPVFTETAERMADAIGTNATAATVLGAGHAAHLEAPELTLALVEDHLIAR